MLTAEPAHAETGVIVSAEQILAVDLQSLLANASGISPREMHVCLSDAINTAHKEHVAAITLLSNLTNCYLTPSDAADPYRAVYVTENHRSIKPTDIAQEQIMELSKAVPQLSHLGLKACLADIVWCRNKYLHQVGVVSVEATRLLLDSLSQKLDGYKFLQKPMVEYSIGERIHRSCVIARTIGWEKPEFSKFKRSIRQLVNAAYNHRDHSGFLRIGMTALNTALCDASTVAEMSEKLANSGAWMHTGIGKHIPVTYFLDVAIAIAKLAGFPIMRLNRWRDEVANTYRERLLERAALAYSMAGDESGRNRCRLQVVEHIVKQARSREKDPLASAMMYKKAIEKARQVPGTKDRQRDIYRRMRDVQSQIPSVLTRVPITINANESDVEAIASIPGSSLLNALFTLFGCVNIPCVEQLVDNALMCDSLLDSVSIIPIDANGDFRYSAKQFRNMSVEESGRVLHKIAVQRSFCQTVAVKTRIDPARRVLSENYLINEEMFLPFFGVCPFVPQGHEFLFARGLLRFLGGEDIEAACMLIPQFESGLCNLFEVVGVDTTSLRTEGYQTEATLGTLFRDYRNELEMVLGEDIVFEADLLFNYRPGISLRNNIAHGRISAADMFQPHVVYGCWLVLRIVATIVYSRREEFRDILQPLNVDNTGVAVKCNNGGSTESS